uniref:Uncharacterized protein n=1 Tax=Electrophorus electricus TaxID=8005 RepID=A0A4W4GJW7_ELEEL
MKSQSWLKKNWFWVAGGAFVGLHLVTWVMQKAMKRTVRSELELKQKRATED